MRRMFCWAAALLVAVTGCLDISVGAGGDVVGPGTRPIDAVLTSLEAGHLSDAYEQADSLADMDPENPDMAVLASVLDLILFAKSIGLAGTDIESPDLTQVLRFASPSFGAQQLRDFLVEAAARLDRAAVRLEPLTIDPGYAFEVPAFTVKVIDLAATLSDFVPAYGRLDLSGTWDAGLLELIRATVLGLGAVADIVLAHELDADWAGLDRFLDGAYGEHGLLTILDGRVDSSVIYLLNDPGSPGFLALGDDGPARYVQAADRLAAFAGTLPAAFALLLDTDPEPAARVVSVHDDDRDRQVTYERTSGLSDALVLPPFTPAGSDVPERARLSLRTSYERLLARVFASAAETEGEPLRLVSDVGVAAAQFGLWAVGQWLSASSYATLASYLGDNDETVASLLDEFLGDPAVLRLGRWLRHEQGALRDALPAWDTVNEPQYNYFVLESDCSLYGDPYNMTEGDRLTEFNFCDDDYQPYPPDDVPHFTLSVEQDVFGDLSIPADDVPSPLVYVAWRDAGFGGLLDLELGGLSHVAEDGWLDGEDLGMRPATSYTLNKTVAIVGARIEPFLDGIGY